MKKSLARHCPECKKYGEFFFEDSFSGTPLIKILLDCPHCHTKWGETIENEDILQRCPVCTCRQFYTSKDFNQLMGCLVMLVGILLVPKTYGFSLPIFCLIDGLIYKKVPTIVNCYRCGSEFRRFPIPERLKPFMHHIGLKYDKYRK